MVCPGSGTSKKKVQFYSSVKGRISSTAKGDRGNEQIVV